MRELRLRKLQELVLRDGSVEVETIAAQLDVSRETIRRDLTALADYGLVIRTRGGATAPGSSLTELDLSVRSREQRGAKEAMARYVATHLIEDGTSVALDTGTTISEIARAIRGRRVTVVTTSLSVINELAATDTTVVVVGGVLRRESLATVGPIAEQITKQFQCDLAFVSGPAISPEHGLMDTDLDGVAVKQHMINHARAAYAVLDHTKLNRAAFTTVSPLSALTSLITDAAAEPDDLQRLAAAGMDVLVAPATARSQSAKSTAEGL